MECFAHETHGIVESTGIDGATMFTPTIFANDFFFKPCFFFFLLFLSSQAKRDELFLFFLLFFEANTRKSNSIERIERIKRNKSMQLGKK